MSGFSNPILGGGGALVYPSIHSPNFVPGQAGWSIDKNGEAFFYGVTLTGGSLIITGAGQGVFIYSTHPPAAGTLIASITQAAGTDAYGNAYLAGVTTYTGSGSTWSACQQDAAGLIFWAAASYAGPWSSNGNIMNDPGGDLLMTAAGILAISIGVSTGFDLTASGLAYSGTSWQNLVGATGWIAGGAQWQPVPVIGAIAFRGLIETPASGSYNGVPATQAIASPLPAATRRWPVVDVSTVKVTGYAIYTTGGVIEFEGLPASYNSSLIEINGLVWL